MNTQEVIKNVQRWGGSVALISAAGVAYAITKGLRNRKKYERPFDPGHIEEIEGKILDIEHTDDKKEDLKGVYAILETEDQVVPVHLGPAWYINHQNRRFKKGDKVRVKGSRVKYNGSESIVPMQVFKNNEMLELRDEKGNPHWLSWKKV